MAAMAAMHDLLSDHDAGDLLQRLDQLVEIGVSLSRERDIDKLLESILVAAKSITNADGGTLYRMQDGRKLGFEIMRNDTLGIAMGGTSGVAIPFYPVSLYDEDGKPVNSMVVAYAVHHDCSINIADAYTEAGFDFSGTKRFDQKTGYRSQSFLTIPIKNHENEIIGVLQLINAKDRETGVVKPFSEADRRLVESLASQAAIALTNRLLINHLEELFESFIKVINAAIDEKSPYTGGAQRSRSGTDHDAGRGGQSLRPRPAEGFHDDRAGPLRAEDRGPAARLRQGDHAGSRRRQGDEAADDIRPHRADRHALRSRQARRADRAFGRSAGARGTPRRDRGRSGVPAPLQYRQRVDGSGRSRARAWDRPQVPLERPEREGDRFPERGRAREPHRALRNAHRRRAPGHQSPHRRDDPDARGAAVAEAPVERGRIRRRPP